ncbi:hypothetical protein CEXT_359231 [Caerostris extrusa]|uniref:Uncharacterized protein n=1 Tax=Caerostris extrusa TaxID=172846 RepID=A0AAV4Y6U3_CAEEX|nr:hypothetical protein CEXT_359231 [Caerostris extrusa]
MFTRLFTEDCWRVCVRNKKKRRNNRGFTEGKSLKFVLPDRVPTESLRRENLRQNDRFPNGWEGGDSVKKRTTLISIEMGRITLCGGEEEDTKKVLAESSAINKSDLLSNKPSLVNVTPKSVTMDALVVSARKLHHTASDMNSGFMFTKKKTRAALMDYGPASSRYRGIIAKRNL